MGNWFMLTVIGKDRPGIVAHVTAALFDAGCNLGAGLDDAPRRQFRHHADGRS